MKSFAITTTICLLVLNISTAVAGVEIQSNDNWPDECENAPTVDNTGVYNGAIDSPRDVDTLIIQIPNKGDYVSFAPRVPAEYGDFFIEVLEMDGDFTDLNLSFEEGVEVNYRDSDEIEIHGTDGNRIENSSWEIWAEQQETQICISIWDDDFRQANLPYEWELRLQLNNPTAVVVNTENRRLKTRVTNLERLLGEKNETIANLRSQINNSTG